MALCELHIYSESLGMQETVYVVLPQKHTGGEIGVGNSANAEKYKCLYLLHGLSDDESIWLRRTSIERYATEYGICVVMPSGGRSFYTDMKYGLNYYTYIAKELPLIIREFFNVSDKREDNFIAGLSMGGYGALKIGLKNCDSFSHIAGLSSVADIEAGKGLFKSDYDLIFGEEIPDDENLFALAKAQKDHKNRPKIYMGVGTDDMLYQGNVALSKEFTSLGYDITYRESKGDHNWAFWDEYIQYVLEWILK